MLTGGLVFLTKSLLCVCADKSLSVSLVGDADEAKAFQGGSSPREDSGILISLSFSLSSLSVWVTI